MNILENISTEQRNPKTVNIDKLSTLELVQIINEEDRSVPQAIAKILPEIARAIDIITEKLAQGGRLFYVGAGTSGRLGILDAVECRPTFSVDPEMVQGLIAGGTPAIFQAQEGAEDSEEAGANDLEAKHLNAKDVVVGIAASGRTPYVLGALKYAQALHAPTIGISCSANPALDKFSDILLLALVGPEIITGSTRLKAGTAQKLILNMLSSCSMIKLGKVYGNLMVDVKASNKKLEERAKRIVMTVTGVSETEASTVLKESKGNAKKAIFMILAGVDELTAEAQLSEAKGNLRTALEKLHIK
ncbi:MAG: N-acetylmuramic acid 6-phosphate etherase [Phascolarctobacterium sp.]|nr:N-acetylmuramic acid 6-phosphate etherase [Phascolarctobacterium sp.]